MPESPFFVNVAALLANPGTRRLVRARGPMSGLAVTGSEVPAGAEVDVHLALEAVPGAVMARGTVGAPWRGSCRRCLVDSGGDLRVEVNELFEADHEPEQTYPLSGDHIDLEPLAREAVMLDLPQAPLCQETCQGLCPQCGTDLNHGACGCQAETGDPRWAPLDALREG